MEFKSQICTTKEQSERLLKLGLKKETADMLHYKSASMKEWGVLATPFTAECKHCKCYFPAWSLHRLMEIAYKGDILGCVALNFHEKNIGSYYELVIKVIEYLINVKEFNQEYLEEKQ